MPKYRTYIPFCVWQKIVVEADNIEDAEEQAYQRAGLNTYVGNGGSAKLVGVSDDSTLEICETPIDLEPWVMPTEEIE